MSGIIGQRRGQTKIRAPRRPGVQGDDVDFDSTWATLAAAFAEIHTKNASKLSYEELYRFAYRLVLKKQGDRLYEKVKAFEQEWLAKNVRADIAEQAKTSLYSGAHGRSTSTAIERRVAGENFLREMQLKWEEHVLCIGMLADVLMYMDRVYCNDNRKPNMYQTGMDLFRDCNLHSRIILEDGDSPSLLQFLATVILDQIAMERAGDVVDRGLIRACIHMLEALAESNAESSDVKLYHSSFEDDFLEASREFYREEGEKLLRECDAGSYCIKVTSRIREEQTRCRAMLSEGTTEKIEHVVEDELIRHKIQEIIDMESGVRFMIDNDRLDELKMIFDIEGRVDNRRTQLMKALQKRVTELGTEINDVALSASSTAAPQQTAPGDDAPKDRDEAAPAPGKATNLQTSSAINWVADVLRLKEKFDKILSSSFSGDGGLGAALTRAFSEFINNSTFTRSSEYISLFIDENMKKGIKDKTEAEIDATLSSAITLLRYIQDKDLFERYYKKHLSKRLIMAKSLNVDVEKDMIGRMKIDLGNTFTQKLEAMFKDITISEELVKGYRDHVNALGDVDPMRVELGIHVLTSMTWPIEALGASSSVGDDSDARGLSGRKEMRIVYPSAIERVKLGFEKYYSEKHNGRKLTWMPNMGTADIVARYAKNHKINVSTYAMIILLLFNDLAPGQSLSLEEIQARTNIPHHELVRNLQSLSVAPKTRLLRKDPMSRDIKPGDAFSINDGFTSKFLHIKVGVVVAGGAGAANKVENERERRETEQKNDDTRRFAVEAAIVRIMKQRKTLAHQQLILETLEQLKARFKPDVAMIKQRVDALIDREYLERVEDANPPAYKYLA